MNESRRPTQAPENDADDGDEARQREDASAAQAAAGDGPSEEPRATDGTVDRDREDDMASSMAGGDDGSDKDAGKPPAAAGGNRSGSGGMTRALATIAILVALTVAGFGGYLFQRLHELEDRLTEVPDERAAAIDAAVADVDVRNELDRLAARLDDQADAREALAQDVAGRLTTLSGELAEIRELAVGHHTRWRLAEVRYLVEIGIRRLQLATDREGAIAAFEAADEALHRLGDARVLPLRQAIVEDVARIRELERADVEGIALRLLNLERGIESLPLATETEEVAVPEIDLAPGSFWEGLVERLRGLVVIRHRSVEPAPEPEPDVDADGLPPAEALRHHLRQARLAALNGDPERYRQSLETAREIVGEAFAADDQRVERFGSRLAELSNRPVRVEVPDFGPTLDKMAALVARISADAREADNGVGEITDPGDAAGDTEGDQE